MYAPTPTAPTRIAFVNVGGDGGTLSTSAVLRLVLEQLLGHVVRRIRSASLKATLTSYLKVWAGNVRLVD